MTSIEPFDWGPERRLVLGLAGRAGVIAQYVIDANEREQRRASEMVRLAVDETGLTIEQFIERLSADDHKTELLAMAAEAARRAQLAAKVRALAGALAAGVLANDDAAIADAQLIVATLRNLDAPHISAMLQILAAGEDERRYPISVVRQAFGDNQAAAEALVAALVREGVMGVPPKTGMGFSPDPVQITAYGERVLAFLQDPNLGMAGTAEPQ